MVRRSKDAGGLPDHRSASTGFHEPAATGESAVPQYGIKLARRSWAGRYQRLRRRHLEGFSRAARRLGWDLSAGHSGHRRRGPAARRHPITGATVLRIAGRAGRARGRRHEAARRSRPGARSADRRHPPDRDRRARLPRPPSAPAPIHRLGSGHLLGSLGDQVRERRQSTRTIVASPCAVPLQMPAAP